MAETEQGWRDLNAAYQTPRGECGDCGSRFPEDDTFTYRGVHFCTECASALASWLLDGGHLEEPDRYDWVGLSDLHESEA